MRRPSACLELAILHIERTGDLDAAGKALDAASRISQRYYSFHSWHQSAVRRARGRLRSARITAVGATPRTSAAAAAAPEEEEEDEDEDAYLAGMRAHVEKEEAAAAAAAAAAAVKVS